MIVGGRIAVHARERPDAVALTFDSSSISWRDLEASLGDAAAWIETNSPQGKSVALHLQHSPALALIFLAAVRMGREVQILDTQWPQSICAMILQKLEPGLIVTNGQQMTGANVRCISDVLFEFNSIKKIFGPEKKKFEWPSVDSTTPFYTGFTSGTTGLPKGYRRSHHSWIVSFDAAQSEFHLEPNDVILAPGTLTHSLFLFALAYAVHIGAHCVLARTFRPDHVVELARNYHASVFFAVPAQIGLVARFLQTEAGVKLPMMRWLISSGSKWGIKEHPEIRVLFPDARFAEFYGASETSFITIAHENGNIPEGSVGRAFDGVEICIRNNEGRELQTGNPGRIFVRSAMTFTGYAIGGEGFTPPEDGCISIGDIGYRDDHGNLFLVGRENRMIVTSGKNMFPEEVELVLDLHPSIVSSAVIGAPDNKRGEKPVAILSLEDGDILSRSSVISFARAHLPLFKVPRDYYLAKDWPITRSGKTDIPALTELWRHGMLERLT